MSVESRESAEFIVESPTSATRRLRRGDRLKQSNMIARFCPLVRSSRMWKGVTYRGTMYSLKNGPVTNQLITASVTTTFSAVEYGRRRPR
jgi:hypothetical protein